MKTAQQLRTHLQSGQVSIGSWLQIPSPDVAEIMAKNGYDWLVLDMEHAAMSAKDFPNLFRAIECGGALPMVRLRDNSQSSIKAALDAGAKGLIFPMLTSRAELDICMEYTAYPEEKEGTIYGKRGIGYGRANAFGQNFTSYYAQESKEIFLVAQVEHILAVEDLENMVQHPRLDAILVGPYDLSGSMGIAGDFEHPDFLKAKQRIADVCKKYNINMGIHVVQPNESALLQSMAEGYTFIAYGIDAVFLWSSSARPKGQ